MQRINTPTAVAIGKFDGTHIGHQKLIRELADTARANGLKPVILLINTDALPVDEKEEQKQRLFSFGAEDVVELDLTPEIRKMSADQFLEEILLDCLSMKYLVGGTDLTFGYRKEGNAAFLEKNAKKLGFRYKLIDKIRMDESEALSENNETVSSTLLHSKIREGNMEAVKLIAGKNYDITGPVLHGTHIGTDQIGVPTLNQEVKANRSLPPRGVYISKVTVSGEEDSNGEGKGRLPVFYGISNLGVRPSIHSEKETVNLETHLFGCSPKQDLYGRTVKTELLHFMRPERQFDTLSQLQRQITEKDIPEALEYLNRYKENM